MNDDGERALTTMSDAEVLDLCDRFADRLLAKYKGDAPFPEWRELGDRLHRECRRRGITRSAA